jgi:hypothetical protein
MLRSRSTGRRWPPRELSRDGDYTVVSPLRLCGRERGERDPSVAAATTTPPRSTGVVRGRAWRGYGSSVAAAAPVAATATLELGSFRLFRGKREGKQLIKITVGRCHLFQDNPARQAGRLRLPFRSRK